MNNEGKANQTLLSNLQENALKGWAVPNLELSDLKVSDDAQRVITQYAPQPFVQLLATFESNVQTLEQGLMIRVQLSYGDQS